MRDIHWLIPALCVSSINWPTVILSVATWMENRTARRATREDTSKEEEKAQNITVNRNYKDKCP